MRSQRCGFTDHSTKQSAAAAISVRIAETAINVFVYLGFKRGSLYGTSDTSSTASPATRPRPEHCGHVLCTRGERTPPGDLGPLDFPSSCVSPLIPLAWLENEAAYIVVEKEKAESFFCCLIIPGSVRNHT